MWGIYFCCIFTALNTCISLINERDALLIAKDLREKNIGPENWKSQQNRVTDFFFPHSAWDCYDVRSAFYLSCIFSSVVADNSLSINGSCAITELRACVQQDWDTVGPAEDAVSVLDWNVFIFLACHRIILEAEREGWYKSVTHSFTLWWKSHWSQWE